MATLTAIQKQQVRNWMEQKALLSNVPVTWVKAAVDAAAQAVEDLLVSNATAISNAINAASTPHGVTFTVTQKRMLVALVFQARFLADRDG